MSTLAIIHPTDLLAVELRESLDRRRDLWEEMLLLSSSEDEIGALTEVRGAAAIVTQLESGSLDDVDVAFFSSAMDANRDILAGLPGATAAVLLAPDAEAGDGHPIVAGVNLEQANRETPMINPHPATVLLAHLLYPLLAFGPRRTAATVLQPVSMVGKSGLDEMLGQTRSILAFDNDPPRQVFPFQMVFNVVPAQTPTVHLETQLYTVLGCTDSRSTGSGTSDSPGNDSPGELQLSIDLLQAGIFHSFSASIYLELAVDPGGEAVRKALGEHPMNQLAESPETLGPIDAAACDKVLIGKVAPAGAASGGYRLWAVMDNLTCGGASNAIQILEAITRQVMH